MLPLTEVYQSEGDGNGPNYKVVQGFRQKRPYNLVLPLNMRYGSFNYSSTLGTNFGTRFTSNGAYCAWCAEMAGSPQSTDNIAYARFVGKMRGSTADLGTTLGEHKSARQLMTARSRQLVQLTRALLRRDFRRAYAVARQDFPSKGISPPKSVANLILEWSWGWAPMIQDIGKALEVLTDPITPIYVRAAGRSDERYTNVDYLDEGDSLGDHYAIREVDQWVITRISSTGGRVTVDNPNTTLKARLGLLELPKIIWATQPMSFIVDKYVNIGQMIGSLTDTYGFQLSDTWTSRRVQVFASGRYSHVRTGLGGNPPIHPLNDVREWAGFANAKIRGTGLLGPHLAIRTPSVGSFSEAVSYMALLVQMLSKK